MEASDHLRNLDPHAGQSAQISEAAIYQLWKSIAPFQGLLREDMRRQTNAIMITTGDMVVPEKGKRLPFEQEEAHELTQLFAERFEQVAQNGHAASPLSSTNEAAVGGDIDPETHSKIIDLAMQAEVAQGSALEKISSGNMESSVKEQRLSYSLLKKIEELLPKPPPQQSSQEQRQNNPEQQDQGQESEQEQSQKDEEQQSDEEPEQPPPPDETDQQKN